MTTISFTEARKVFPSLFTKVLTTGERVILERHGHEHIALVPIADLEALQRLEDRRDVAEAEAALGDAADFVPWEQVKKELGLSR
jgi:PHD/YefM family antitoxin component YafN of YafNO toxin-antitoxin module